MGKLLIIDGNAIVHRAFHAYPPQLTTPDGRPNNAVYGFLAMLVKVLEEVKPEYLTICFDRPAPTFRKLLYPRYQANRPQMADGLSDQIKLLHVALEHIKIPLFEIDGYEADDVIGTLSVQAKEQGLETVILSGDRDLLQLVNNKVSVFMPLVGITKFLFYTPENVEEKYGVKTSQFIDYKALVGDASDGYPGITGIGPKTAATLLQKYGSFESLYEHINELKPQIAEKLATDAEQGALAKKLATIAKDVPVYLQLAPAEVSNFTRESVIEVCQELGINSLQKRLGFFKESGVAIKKISKKSEKNENQLELI